MGMNSMKKWEKPELLILVRGRPDDAVLVGCKGGVVGAAATDDALCVTYDAIARTCPDICSAVTPS